MKAVDTHEVEVTLHLRVPKSTPERHIERLRMALLTVAADMDGVIEAGVGPSTPHADTTKSRWPDESELDDYSDWGEEVREGSTTLGFREWQAATDRRR